MNTLGVGDLPIESKMLTNSLSEAQRKVGCRVVVIQIRVCLGFIPGLAAPFALQAYSAVSRYIDMCAVVDWFGFADSRQNGQIADELARPFICDRE